MADDKRETRKAILGELESIKDLLLDQEDIPILNDAIDTPPIVSTAFDQEGDLPPPDSTGQRAPGKDPPLADAQDQETQLRQTALAAEVPETRQYCAPSSDKPNQEKACGIAKTAVATAFPRENPFLPKHIRDRLHTHRSLVDEIKSSPIGPRRGPRGKDAAFADSPSFAAVTAHLPTTANSPNAIVDELIAEFMPKIEAELRRRLDAIIQAPDQKPEDTNKR